MYLRASLGFWKRHTSSCYSPCDVQPNSFLLVLGDNRDYSERWPMSIWKCSADTHGYSGIVAASLTHCGEPSWHTKQRVNSCGGKCCHQDDSQKMLFVSQVDEISEEVWVDHCSYPQADRPQQQFPTVPVWLPDLSFCFPSVTQASVLSIQENRERIRRLSPYPLLRRQILPLYASWSRNIFVTIIDRSPITENAARIHDDDDDDNFI